MEQIILSDNKEKLIKVNQTSGKLIIPDTVKIIGERAAEDEKIEEVIFPKNLEMICDDAFSGTKIKNITIENNVNLSYAAFFNNRYLENIDISTRRIQNFCFTYCGRNTTGVNINLKDTISIKSNAFAYAFIKNINMPHVEYIECNSFRNAYFTTKKLVLPNNLKEIKEQAFADTNLADIYLPESIINITDLFTYTKANIHMSKKVFKKLGLIKYNNVILDEDSINNLLDKYTFKEINNKILNNEIYLEV